MKHIKPIKIHCGICYIYGEHVMNNLIIRRAEMLYKGQKFAE